MFWRLFLTYLLFVFAAVALVGVFILNRAEPLFYELVWHVVAGVALIALLAIVPAYMIAQRFARPVVDLNEGARRLADGDFGPRRRHPRPRRPRGDVQRDER
jgi:two-component system, OmpR family, phosphate regulon sensor histidine kinase PhoR